MKVNTVEKIFQTFSRWLTLSHMQISNLGPLVAGGHFCLTLSLLEVEP